MLSKTVTAAIAKASNSPVRNISWPERGRAPAGYVKGMAAVFTLVYEALKKNDPAALAMVRVVDEPGKHDVFDAYEPIMLARGFITRGASLRDRLRYLFVILFGLGMRESTGRYCCGRDTTAVLDVSAETAEAGPFQQSWDSRGASTEITRLFNTARGKTFEDIREMLDVWKEGVTVKSGDNGSFGRGDGMWFQVLLKQDMDFAVKVAAIALRTRCNAWGPINREEVAIVAGVDTLLSDIQDMVDAESLIVAPPAAAKSLGNIIVDIIRGWFSSKPKAPAPTVPAPAPLRPVPTVASPNPIWVRQGLKEVGFHEVGVNRGIERYIELGKCGQLGDPWCAIFVNAMLEFAGVTGSRSAAAYSFEVSRNFVKLDGPAYGSITTMWRGNPRKAGQQGEGHVGFYLGEGPEGVTLLDGNDGDGVRISEPKSRIRVVGYYWPMWMPLPKIGAIPYDARAIVAQKNGQGQKET